MCNLFGQVLEQMTLADFILRIDRLGLVIGLHCLIRQLQHHNQVYLIEFDMTIPAVLAQLGTFSQDCMEEYSCKYHPFVNGLVNQVLRQLIIGLFEFIQCQIYSLLYLVGNSRLFFKGEFQTVVQYRNREFILWFSDYEYFDIAETFALYDFFDIPLHQRKLFPLQVTVVDL